MRAKIVSHRIAFFVVLRNARKSVIQFVQKQGVVFIWWSIHTYSNDVFPLGYINLNE